ncbi:MAG: hypothetical protein ACRD2G_02860 [Terriglobia bacterium]
MKLAGFLLLLAGWVILLAALALFRAVRPRDVFVLVGAAIEIAGLILAARSHRAQRGESK